MSKRTKVKLRRLARNINKTLSELGTGAAYALKR